MSLAAVPSSRKRSGVEVYFCVFEKENINCTMFLCMPLCAVRASVAFCPGMNFIPEQKGHGSQQYCAGVNHTRPSIIIWQIYYSSNKCWS